MIKKWALVLFACSAAHVGVHVGVIEAAPQKIEMIFLSPKKVAQIQELLNQIKFNPHKSSLLATSTNTEDLKDCVPMGDGCFHPQMGFIERNSAIEMKGPKDNKESKEMDVQVKTFNNMETSLINCDKDNYFDIFCGKEKAQGKHADIEVWFDISSSLKSVDYSQSFDQCARSLFADEVYRSCKDRVNFYAYNTSLKEISERSGACMSHGTNDQKKLLSWMQNSEAKYLLVITDIDEMSSEMRAFLEGHGAKMVGDGVKNFTTQDLLEYAKDFAKICR